MKTMEFQLPINKNAKLVLHLPSSIDLVTCCSEGSIVFSEETVDYNFPIYDIQNASSTTKCIIK